MMKEELLNIEKATSKLEEAREQLLKRAEGLDDSLRN